MFRTLPLVAAFAVLIVSGLIHGLWTQRWHSSRDLDNAVARLQSVGPKAGPWSSVNVDVDPEPYQQARAVGYWMRRYTKPGFAGSFSVILMCGRAGHMAVHTPDVCYRGAGYESAGEPSRETIALTPPRHAEFWTTVFRQPGKVTGTALRIYWAWSYDGHWQAPSSPRWTFGGSPYLYKLYVVSEDAEGRSDASTEFLQQLLPELQRSLFSADGRSPEL
jgi:hypothetical protein